MSSIFFRLDTKRREERWTSPRRSGTGKEILPRDEKTNQLSRGEKDAGGILASSSTSRGGRIDRTRAAIRLNRSRGRRKFAAARRCTHNRKLIVTARRKLVRRSARWARSRPFRSVAWSAARVLAQLDARTRRRVVRSVPTTTRTCQPAGRRTRERAIASSRLPPALPVP